MLNKKMTLMACAISSSSASITGAVAAIAEPPQIDDPTPTRVEILVGILRARCRAKEITSDVVIVATIMGSERAPTRAIWERLRPKPNRITAYCKIFLEVNLIPGANGNAASSLINSASTIPMRMAKTGPPITSKRLPKNHAGRAISRHSATPLQLS